MTFNITYLTFFSLLFSVGFLQAQVSTCDLQAGSDDVTVDYSVISETANGDGTCDYLLQVTVTADDGNADADITVDIILDVDPPSSEVITKTVTLQAGQSSMSFPINAAAVTYPCGQTGTITTSISGGSSTCTDVPAELPVELVAFNLNYITATKVELTWETASEIENMGFEVQRSQDTYKWETLDFVKGNLTTLEAQNYSWTDTKPLNQSISYYRLKQVDTDGTYAYSDIVVAKNKPTDGKVDIFPNPGFDVVNVTLPEATTDAIVEIYSMSNQLLQTVNQSTNNGVLNVNISQLASGSYYLIVRTDSDQFVEKLMKQ